MHLLNEYFFLDERERNTLWMGAHEIMEIEGCWVDGLGMAVLI